MRGKVLFALLVGGVVGVLCGLVESVVCLVQAPAWRVESAANAAITIAIGIGVYGALNALVTVLWGLAAARMETRVFRVRTRLFAILPMAYVFGGYYANMWWFPSFRALPSVLFTVAWTLACLIAVWALLRFRVASSHGPRSSGWGVRRVGLAVLGLAIVAGLAIVTGWLQRGAARPAPQQGPLAGLDRPNLLLIVMDTTRANHLSCYGHPRQTTPILDRLAQEGVLFEQASAAAPWTLPSHASLFTGLYPSQHGTDWSHRRLDDRLTTLVERLHEHGYQTVGFSNNPWVSQATNFQQGFDHLETFRRSWRPWQPWAAGNYLAIFQIADKVEEWLRYRQDAGAALTNQRISRWFSTSYDPRRPFFLFINYMEAHAPYDPPEPYRSRFARHPSALVERAMQLRNAPREGVSLAIDPTLQAVLADLYDGELAYLDAKIGEVLSELRARGLLENSIAVVTSDHGEHLGDHELLGHQFSIYETLLHVPLIIRDPQRLPRGVRVAQPVSLVDVMPNLLALVGLESSVPSGTLPGQQWFGSSLRVLPDRDIVAEYVPPPRRPRADDHTQSPEGDLRRAFKSLRNGPFKFILASDGRRELYDLSRDPTESENRIAQFPEQARMMEAALKQLDLTLKPVGAPEEVPELDETTREELRALGYLQ